MKLASVKVEKSLKAGNSRLVRVDFSGGLSFLFPTDYLDENVNLDLWEEGLELSPPEEEAMRFAAACYRAEKAALRLIARAEQSSFGLKVKLERKGFDASVARMVISRLLDRKLLDENRFAELWIRSRLGGKAPTPLWFLVSLGKRGIDRDVSKKAIRCVLDDETEYTLLLNYLTKMDIFQEAPGIIKMRLKHEGFSADVINRFFDSQ